jgi:hypothetical protein
MPLRARWRGLLSVLASLTLVAAPAAGSAEASTPFWPTPSQLMLPADAAVPPVSPNASVASVSCPSAGNCVAVGTYIDTSKTTQLMYAVQSGGAWGQAVEVQPPPNVGPAPGFRGLTSVSCTSVGYCVAVGLYKSTDAPFRGLTLTETGGVWGQAAQIKPYPGESTTGPGDGLGSVSCTSAGNCAASGIYVGPAGGEPMVVSEVDGQWGTPIALDQPSGSGGTNATTGVKVSCSSQGNCVAAAQYLASVVPNDNRPMVVTETAGVWGQAIALQLPANANTTITQQNAHVHGVSCPQSGECVVVGDYVAGSETHPWAATETAGA